MSKKKFSEGLDDLFKDTHAGGDLFGGDTVAARPPERKSAHKNFMTDLDALLQDALDESLERFESGRQDADRPSGKSKSGGASARPAAGGLDALIRQTIDVQELTTDEQTGKKRLTVAVDKSKLEKLKAIARLENSYMKDLLVELIDGYIEEYTKEKGIDL